jgi:C-terminal processing protease CtpA/Prc
MRTRCWTCNRTLQMEQIMKASHHNIMLRRTAQLTTLAVLVLPGLAAASEASDRREMEQRERAQRQALRGQEETIERMEERLEQARRRLEESSREVAKLSSDLGRNYTYNFGTVVTAPPRALLGISVDTGERRDGALVAQVSPGGAAEEAGIRRGDIITSLDGKDLTKENSPGRALVDQLQQVKPDTKVKVALLRDGKKMNFDVTTRAAPQFDGFLVRNRNLRTDPFQGQRLALADSVVGNSLGGMEFATLSDRLGDYFGVDQGVLVVRAGTDAPYGLQDGDVILSIDGRAPTNAQHAGRILRSYQPGEKVKLRVQRDRKAVELDVSAPDGRGGGRTP